MAVIFNSFCARLCSGTCGILVTRKGQTITEVRGDPETASKLGLKDGDPIHIETPRGKIRQTLRSSKAGCAPAA